MKKVLVTGGAGFIGSATVKQLLDTEGVSVAVVDNFDDTYERKFKEEHIAEFLDNDRFTLFEKDIVDYDELDSIFKTFQPTHVLHLAAKADTRQALLTPQIYIDTNITGTLNVLELSVKHNVQQVVAASSSSVYGNNSNTPWREDDLNLQPLSPYGVTKLSTEYLAYTYYKNHDLPITMLRYFNAYGECNRPNMVPYIWMEAILNDQTIEISGDGSRRRDYTYVGDIARGTILALQKDLGFRVLNLGYGSPLSLQELLGLLKEVTNKEVTVKSRPSHKASVDVTYADVHQAKELLGWEPEVSHTEGMKRLLRWFTDHRLKK